MDDKQLTTEAPQAPGYEERDASFDSDAPVETELSDAEVQDTILEDSDMTGFQKFVARLDDDKWTLYQRILGVVLGLLAGVALFWNGLTDSAAAGSSGTYSLVIAVVVAMLIPNIIERRGLRKIPKARTMMVITLAIVLVGYLLLWGVRTGFTFKA